MPMARNTAQPDSVTVERLLEPLPGIRRVDLTDFPEEVAIEVEPLGVSELTSSILQSWIQSETGMDTDVRVDVRPGDFRASPRSRLESVDVSHPDPGRIIGRVTLEWAGERWTGQAEDVWNPASELRVCALAALRAVEATIDAEGSFDLIGVKELQVFDHRMVVVLVNCPAVPGNRLIGIAQIVESRFRAAAAAALHATNRVVGRFLGE